MVNRLLVAELYPFLLEFIRHGLEVLNRIVLTDVIVLEWLHQHQNEQIQHNVLDNDCVENEEGLSKI